MRAHVLNPSPTETAIWGELSTKCLGKTPQKLAQCRIWDTKKAKSNQDCPPNVSQKKKSAKACSVQNLRSKERKQWSGLSIKFQGKTQKLAHDRIWDTKKTKSDQDCLSNFTEKLHEKLAHGRIRDTKKAKSNQERHQISVHWPAICMLSSVWRSCQKKSTLRRDSPAPPLPFSKTAASETVSFLL